MSRYQKLSLTITLAALILAGGFLLLVRDPGSPTPPQRLARADRTFDSDDPVKRACGLSTEILARVWRGRDPRRSEDIIMVPQDPNYSGIFGKVNHSGPWDYLMRVPLVFYGPDRISATGRVARPVSIADVFPTVGELVDVDLPPREGDALEEVVSADREGVPRLVVTVVWDGVGRNVLNEWPGRWPTLERLERDGVSYLNASVGSSPSITPATHTTLGTGAYPRRHGVTGIFYRASDGSIREAFAERDTSLMRLTTYADLVDRAYGNASKVGMVSSRSWHLGMLSHGAAIEGGDADQLAIFRRKLVSGVGEATDFSTPQSLVDDDWSRFEEYAREVDRSDGKVDGKWYGHDIRDGEKRDNPAWVKEEMDAIIHAIAEEDYGDDEIPDLFFTNLKTADTVGHNYLMDSKEMKFVLSALDESLERLLNVLDERVGDYVLILTADHGHTPPHYRTGAWPVGNNRLVADIDEHFEVPGGETLITDEVAVGLFVDDAATHETGVTQDDIARYINGYTIADNWDEAELPEGYEDRGDENIFSAAWPSDRMDEVMECKLGPDWRTEAERLPP